jgi:hypothetical protein
VNYTNPTANDLVDGVVDVTCAPASGSMFNVGSTLVTCKASDSAGNEATSTFHVNVRYAFTASSVRSTTCRRPTWSRRARGSR